MRNSKIVCTIGPACESEAMMEKLMRAGMDCARLNFSHGSHEDHGRRLQRLRKVAAKLGRSIAILQDLQGPKIRTGKLEGGKPVRLVHGAKIWITTRVTVGTAERVSTTYKALVKDVKPGSSIMIDDGNIELRVLQVRGHEVQCSVVVGGLLGESKGINLPGIPVSAPGFSAKDYADLKYGVKMGVNFIALSYVRTAKEVKKVRRILKQLIGKEHVQTKLIAKIERPEAVENLDEILDAADGVMVARGDLGVETDPARVAILQKDIISLANQHRKLVITATQMLDSMIHNPRPTRAEVSDVSNAIYDGTDAVMLSGETATGRYPVKAVEMMSRIVTEVEKELYGHRLQYRGFAGSTDDPTQALVDAACFATNAMQCRAVGIYTLSGRTVWKVAKGRPASRIVAFTSQTDTYQLLNLAWGVTPIMTRFVKNSERLFSESMELMKKHKLVKAGDIVWMLAGTSTAIGSDNTLRFDIVK